MILGNSKNSQALRQVKKATFHSEILEFGTLKTWPNMICVNKFIFIFIKGR